MVRAQVKQTAANLHLNSGLQTEIGLAETGKFKVPIEGLTTTTIQLIHFSFVWNICTPRTNFQFLPPNTKSTEIVPRLFKIKSGSVMEVFLLNLFDCLQIHDPHKFSSLLPDGLECWNVILASRLLLPMRTSVNIGLVSSGL